MHKHVLVVGSSVVDLTFYCERLPQKGETLEGRFKSGLGGKGFNQAVASIQSGAPTRFISAIGDDGFGEAFSRRLSDLGCETRFQKIRGAATGAASICVDSNGNNSIVVSLGANDQLSPAFLNAQSEMFKDCAVLLLQFEISIEAIRESIRLARAYSPDCMIVFNPAPARANVPSEILEQVDVLTPNETELEVLTTNRLAETHRAKKILATLGERGAALFDRETPRANAQAFSSYRVMPIDTAGAGDAFNGGFASGLLKYKDIHQAVSFASKVAAISVTREGTSASMPTLSEISEFKAELRPLKDCGFT